MHLGSLCFRDRDRKAHWESGSDQERFNVGQQ